jgi:hypothetical protein
MCVDIKILAYLELYAKKTDLKHELNALLR